MKKILMALCLVVLGFLGYIAAQPADYMIFREVTIDATPEVIFPYVNNAKKMDTWNPWIELDPNVRMEFSGPEEGVGAKTSWSGGEKLGTGSATVTESIPPSVVRTQLEYTEPHVMTQRAEISLTPSGKQTVVRWSVSGENPFIGRVICFFMNMDKMIGGIFENGLNNLKAKVEEKR